MEVQTQKEVSAPSLLRQEGQKIMSEERRTFSRGNGQTGERLSTGGRLKVDYE